MGGLNSTLAGAGLWQLDAARVLLYAEKGSLRVFEGMGDMGASIGVDPLSDSPLVLELLPTTDEGYNEGFPWGLACAVQRPSSSPLRVSWPTNGGLTGE